MMFPLIVAPAKYPLSCAVFSGIHVCFTFYFFWTKGNATVAAQMSPGLDPQELSFLFERIKEQQEKRMMDIKIVDEPVTCMPKITSAIDAQTSWSSLFQTVTSDNGSFDFAQSGVEKSHVLLPQHILEVLSFLVKDIVTSWTWQALASFCSLVVFGFSCVYVYRKMRMFRYRCAISEPSFWNLWGMFSDIGSYSSPVTAAISSPPRPKSITWFEYHIEGETRELYRMSRDSDGKLWKRPISGNPVHSDRSSTLSSEHGDDDDSQINNLVLGILGELGLCRVTNDNIVSVENEEATGPWMEVQSQGSRGECQVPNSIPTAVSKITANRLPACLACFTVVSPGGNSGSEVGEHHSFSMCAPTCMLLTRHQRVNMSGSGMKDLHATGKHIALGKFHAKQSDNLADLSSKTGVSGNGSFTHYIGSLAAKTGCVGLLALLTDPGEDLYQALCRICPEDRIALIDEVVKCENMGLTSDHFLIQAPGAENSNGAESVSDMMILFPALKQVEVSTHSQVSVRYEPDEKKIQRLYSLIGVSTSKVKFQKSAVDSMRGRVYFYDYNNSGECVAHYTTGAISVNHAAMTGSGLAAYLGTTRAGGSGTGVLDDEKFLKGELSCVGIHCGAYSPKDGLNGFATIGWARALLSSCAGANLPDGAELVAGLGGVSKPLDMMQSVTRTLQAHPDGSPSCYKTKSSSTASVGESSTTVSTLESAPDPEELLTAGFMTKAQHRLKHAEASNLDDEARIRAAAKQQLAAERDGTESGVNVRAHQNPLVQREALRIAHAEQVARRQALARSGVTRRWADYSSSGSDEDWRAAPSGECYEFLCSYLESAKKLDTIAEQTLPDSVGETANLECISVPVSSFSEADGPDMLAWHKLLDDKALNVLASKVDETISARFDTLEVKLNAELESVTSKIADIMSAIDECVDEAHAVGEVARSTASNHEIPPPKLPPASKASEVGSAPEKQDFHEAAATPEAANAKTEGLAPEEASAAGSDSLSESSNEAVKKVKQAPPQRKTPSEKAATKRAKQQRKRERMADLKTPEAAAQSQQDNSANQKVNSSLVQLEALLALPLWTQSDLPQEFIKDLGTQLASLKDVMGVRAATISGASLKLQQQD